eukprot:4678578-Prymnesium_polylepis.1
MCTRRDAIGWGRGWAAPRRRSPCTDPCPLTDPQTLATWLVRSFIHLPLCYTAMPEEPETRSLDPDVLDLLYSCSIVEDLPRQEAIHPTAAVGKLGKKTDFWGIIGDPNGAALCAAPS